MICERFAFVIVYCVLSGLYPASSWASKQSRQTIGAVEISRDLETIHSDLNSSRNSFTGSPELQKILASSLRTSVGDWESAQADTSPEQPATTIISKRWCWIAMGATGGASLFLLWLLFRKPQHIIESTAESNTDKALSASQEVAPSDRLSPRVETEIEPTAIDDSTQKKAAADIELAEELIRDLQQPDSDNSLTSTNVAVSSPVELKP